MPFIVRKFAFTFVVIMLANTVANVVAKKATVAAMDDRIDLVQAEPQYATSSNQSIAPRYLSRYVADYSKSLGPPQMLEKETRLFFLL